MDDLLILGSGVHAVEMADIVARVNRVQPAYHLRGYVRESDRVTATDLHGLPVLAPEAITERYPSALLVPAYGWVHAQSAGISRQRFISLIDPSVFVASTATIGVGCVLFPQCYVGAYARIGDFVFSLSGSVINHHDIIEDRVALTTGVTLAGQVHVEADCYLGQSSTCRQMLRIGRGSLIGMGSVVVADVPPNSVMAGNPARRLRDNTAPAQPR